MNKYNVYIWGVGEYASEAYLAIDKNNCNFIGYIDIDTKKQGLKINGYVVFSPQEACDNADYVLISIYSANVVIKQAISIGYREEQLIELFGDNLDYFFIDELYRVKRENSLLKLRLENNPFELGVIDTPHLMNYKQMFEKIINNKSSLTRYGDGEFEIMLGRDRPWFQKKNDELSERMRQIIRFEDDGIIIAIADDFGSLNNFTEKAANGIRKYMSAETRKEIMHFIDMNRVYGDAYISRPYLIYKDSSYAENVFSMFKKCWKNRDVIIIEGEYSRIGVGNDLLDSANSVRRILAPAKNAYDIYDDVLRSVKKHVNKNDLVIISLGPAATVLAYDLYIDGIQALDIGQIDTEYEWYLMGAKDREEIPGKSVAELSWWHAPEMEENVDYLEQIVENLAC